MTAWKKYKRKQLRVLEIFKKANPTDHPYLRAALILSFYETRGVLLLVKYLLMIKLVYHEFVSRIFSSSLRDERSSVVLFRKFGFAKLVRHFVKLVDRT